MTHPQAPDAALRERVRKVLFPHVPFGAEVIADQVLAAIREPAATPPPGVGLDGGVWATYDAPWWIVADGHVTYQYRSAVDAAHSHVANPQNRDAKHAELLALKQPAVAPSETLVKHMVDRFLRWRLPSDFSPDGGISFTRWYNELTANPSRHEPTGTNLLTFTQAEQMVRDMLEGYEHPPTPSAPQSETREVLGYGVMADGMLLPFHQWFLGIDGNYTLADTLKWAHEHVAVVEGGTVVELLRGAEVTP